MRPRPRLLLYLSTASDPSRLAVGPTLAAAAARAGWAFDCYYDALRAGRHYGGPTPESVPPGWAAGAPFAGGQHLAKLLWLASRFEVVVVGDPRSSLLPALETTDSRLLALTTGAAHIYEAVFDALGLELPSRLVVVDGRPQGPAGLVVAPYLYPAFFAGAPAIGAEVSMGVDDVAALRALGAEAVDALFVDPRRAADSPLDIAGSPAPAGYAALTAALAETWAAWGAGVLVGDPELVAAQLPKAARLRLLPLHGSPQLDVLRRTEGFIRPASEPVYGRQDDDRDFFELARLGHSLQVVDPSPPFDAAATAPEALPEPTQATPADPSDDQLERWADERRVLLTLVFWAGMIREVDCYAPLFDLLGETGLRAGLAITAEALEHAGGAPLGLLAVPRERGGVLGLVELLLGSTGRGVAAEALLPDGTLGTMLTEGRQALARLLPAQLLPRGWWPLLDAPLAPSPARPVGLRSGRPVVLVTPRPRPDPGTDAPHRGRDARTVAGTVLRHLRLDRLVAERRPYDLARPGAYDERIAASVRSAGFAYMWTKTSFGRPRARVSGGDFVSLPFTAGDWDGWSPFYTLSRAAQLRHAERRLLRTRRPGWLASTIDSPLWLLPGELRQHGHRLHEIATLAAGGGATGELVNVTPSVVARYARVLADREELE